MRRFTSGSVVASAALALTGLGMAPAYADPPAAPGLTLDTPLAGHITGTVTSPDQPVVQVTLGSNGPTQVVTLFAGTGTFDLPTWGFDPAGTTTVSAIACPADPPVETDCSTPASDSFTPVDVRPDVSLDDDTVGPGQTASVSSVGAGGGVLKATWTPASGSATVTVLDPDGTTPLDITDDGDGTVVVTRCADPPVDQCTGFTPPISLDLHVHRTLATSVSTIASITSGSSTSEFTVTADQPGSSTMSWHLEKAGVPVSGTEHTTPALTDTVDGSTLATDGSYRVVGTATVVNPDYGSYTDVPFTSDPFTVDRSGSLPGLTLDAATAGHITGTVTSPDQPFVRVQLGSNGPTQVVTLSAGTGAFDLPTWGFDPAGTTTVSAIACPADPPVETDCSAAATSSFTPVDVRPDVSLDDATVGQGQTASVTTTDPGGGVLKATWTPASGSPTVTVLDQNGTTPLDIPGDGDGSVVVTRCSTVNAAICTGFGQPISLQLHVHRTVVTSVSALAMLTSAHPASDFTVTTDQPGTATLSWHLEKAGVPVGASHTGVPGSSDTVDGSNLPDGTYRVVGTLDLATASYGTYTGVPFQSGSFVVDRSGPVLTSISSSRATLYPLIASTKYPSTTTLSAAGPGKAAVTKLQLWRLGTQRLDLTAANGNAAWNGRIGTNPAPAGTYTIKAVDALGNLSPTWGHVTVSGLRIVTKTWTRIVTARRSMAASFAGQCSTLRRPSARGWAGSLGYYANTRCDQQTWTASGVSTAHAIGLPQAEKYLDVRVDAYGAAARKRPRSQGLIRYLTTSGSWVGTRPVGPRLGWHSGYVRSTAGLVFSDQSFGWSFAAAYRNKYDVAKFRIVLHYKGLG